MDIANVYTEIWEIFKYLNMQDLKKIPDKLILYIYNNKNNLWKFKYNPNIELSKQDVMEETKNLFAIIYYRYCCKSNEKKEIMKNWLKIS